MLEADAKGIQARALSLMKTVVYARYVFDIKINSGNSIIKLMERHRVTTL